MKFYVASFLLTVLFSFLWKKTGEKQLVIRKLHIALPLKYIWAVLSVLPFLLLCTTAMGVGNDWKNYITAYNAIAEGTECAITDKAFVLFCRLTLRMGMGYQGMMALWLSLCFALLLVNICLYSREYAQSWALFFLFGFLFLFGFNQVRQFAAQMLVMLAFLAAEKRKPLPYFALVLLATTCHFTAIIMVPFYWVFKWKPRLSFFAVAALLVLPVNFVYNEALTWLFATFRPAYLGTAYMYREFSLNFQLLSIYAVLCGMIFSYWKVIRDGDVRLQYFSASCLTAAVICAFASWLPEYYRIANYFLLPAIFLVPALLEHEPRRSVRLMWLAALFVTGMVRLYFSAAQWGIQEYRSFLF